MTRFLLPPLLLLAALLLPLPARAACTQINALPYTVTEPGHYCLTGRHDINSIDNIGILIDADHVTLDCDGGTIRRTGTLVNTATNAGIYVATNHHVTIRNCRIVGGFGIGIHVAQDNADPNGNANKHIALQDNFIDGPFWYGILAYGGDLEVTGNRVHDVGGRINSFAMGIRIGASTVAGQSRVANVHDNFVSGTHAYNTFHAAYGIYSENSVNGDFSGNQVIGTTGGYTWGLRVGGSGNRIVRNKVNGTLVANDVGIQSNSATDACYDNHLRTTTPTAVCNAALGNY